MTLFLTYRNEHDRSNLYISSFSFIHNELRKSTIKTTKLFNYFSILHNEHSQKTNVQTPTPSHLEFHKLALYKYSV